MTVLCFALSCWLLRLVAREHRRADDAFFELTLSLAPFVAALASWGRRTSLQLLARAIWWAYLLCGCLASLLSRGRESGRTLLFIVATSAASLLLLGRRGMEEGQGPFAPVAFRGTFIASLVLGLADAGTLLFMGAAMTGDRGRLVPFLLAFAILLGVVGLYRLRVWGLLVSLGANVAVIVCALTVLSRLPPNLRKLFIGSAVLQLLLPVPLIVSLVRGRAPDSARFARLGAVLTSLVVLGLGAFGCYNAIAHGAFRSVIED